MKLVAISSPQGIENEARHIIQLFEAGLQVFHLRKANLNKEEYVRMISDIPPVFHHRISLHNFHELTEDFDIHRLHYSEKLRSECSNAFSADLIKSTSLHDLQLLDRLCDFKYAFLGPVFNSISKPDYKGNHTIKQNFKKQDHIEIFGIGGIDASNIHDMKDLQFDGAALLGALWKNPAKAVQTFKTIQSLC